MDALEDRTTMKKNDDGGRDTTTEMESVGQTEMTGRDGQWTVVATQWPESDQSCSDRTKTTDRTTGRRRHNRENGRKMTTTTGVAAREAAKQWEASRQ